MEFHFVGHKSWDPLEIPVTLNGTQIAKKKFYDYHLTNRSKNAQTELWDSCRPKEVKFFWGSGVLQ